jgi:2-amino-4-hydroxy-6-hydroxymethyldihydropteridine diphosphokinase
MARSDAKNILKNCFIIDELLFVVHGKSTLFLYFCGVMPDTIYLLLGSNEGDRLRLLQDAAHFLVMHLARGHVLYSSIYETAAWGKEDQPPFLNMALRLDTNHPPDLVLTAARQIEQGFGRQRIEVWGQRTLDVDILFYGDKTIDKPDLIIPHQQIQARRFALTPMAEIAPHFEHPVLKKTMLELLAICEDPLEVHMFQRA